MQRLIIPFFLLLILAAGGCASHSSDHANARARVQACGSFPCGGEVIYPDMVINYEIQRTPEDEFILTGTAAPRHVQINRGIDLAILSVELLRDRTFTDTLSFPMIGNDLSQPLRFHKQFKPNGGFDGLTFNWDIRYTD
ncbi:hypothetical protein [uncultured Pseudodesulfovibrio sp.]|uniref:hypothetical protein n=1 Tax=uncultured Pseudodesulfovibrio sp. TaxID=2035858 RepID=UPI0029C9B1E1|nr:hypothetical protein [uncultured Pseudodesulfovibrio sp.]